MLVSIFHFCSSVLFTKRAIHTAPLIRCPQYISNCFGERRSVLFSSFSSPEIPADGKKYQLGPLKTDLNRLHQKTFKKISQIHLKLAVLNDNIDSAKTLMRISNIEAKNVSAYYEGLESELAQLKSKLEDCLALEIWLKEIKTTADSKFLLMVDMVETTELGTPLPMNGYWTGVRIEETENGYLYIAYNS